MILDAYGRPFVAPVKDTPVKDTKVEPPKARMHKCLFCGRRSRLGTHCCNARYREDSKFNPETRHQRLDRLELEKARHG